MDGIFYRISGNNGENPESFLKSSLPDTPPIHTGSPIGPHSGQMGDFPGSGCKHSCVMLTIAPCDLQVRSCLLIPVFSDSVK